MNEILFLSKGYIANTLITIQRNKKNTEVAILCYQVYSPY